jgi:hypothetical protein
MGDEERLLELALTMARDAHDGQTDKAGQPYIGHVLRVVQRVGQPEAKIVAALHDVVEDTDVTLEDLAAAGFPAEVTAAVGALTRQPDEPYTMFVWRAGMNSLAREVKMADLLDNSDPERLAVLPDPEAQRLSEKYGEALHLLQSIDPATESHGVVYLVGERRSSRAIWAEYQEHGGLKLTGQSFGGGGEYEWGLSVEPAEFPALRSLLGGRDDADVLLLLLDATPSLPDGGAHDPIAWLRDRGVGSFWNWIS